MPTLIKNGSVYNNQARSFLPLDVLIDGGRIARVAERGKLDGLSAKTFDADGRRLTAGFIDVHTHGIAGSDFIFADDDALLRMSKAYLSHGVTTVMPTLASAPLEVMVDAARRINSFSCRDGARFCGAHIEGRYLNPQKRGAHAPALLSSLDEKELSLFADIGLDAFHISAAFELDSDQSFLRRALDIGATLSLGHTNASYAEAKALEEAGVTAYTHLYNAMPPLHHRDGGPVAACLLGDAYAELICDGIHISPEAVSLTRRIKREKLTLISDSMEATDSPDGEYSIAGNPVRVEGGIARTLDGALAGSTLTLDRAVENLMRFCDISLEEAILSATEAPAKEIGIFDDCGSIDEGKRADILFIDGAKFEIKRIMRGGALFGV